MRKKEDGAIIIEACILLPIFMFLFLSLYSAVNICFTEIRVQNALNNAARQICQYSYVYSYTGLKEQNDELVDEANSNKEAQKQVVDNFSNMMDSINAVIGGTESAYSDIKADGNLVNLLNSGREIAGNASSAIASGKQIVSYFKGKSLQEVAASLFQVFTADLVEEAKRSLGAALAEWLCESELGSEMTESIDFSKSYLFPAKTSDIVLVAEYEVKIIPYIPIDIKYNISQQVVTRGWLDGDGGKITKNGAIIKAIHKPKENDNMWTPSGEYTLYERVENMRERKTDELKESGYYDLKDKNYLHMYNPDKNIVAYIGSSNPLYGAKINDKSELRPYLEGQRENIKKYLIETAGKLDVAVTSSVTYRIPDTTDDAGKTKQYKTVNPYEAEKNEETKLKREFYLIVPEDPGVKQFYEEVWNEIPEEQKKGVDFKVEAKYQSNFTFFEDEG